MVDLLHWPPSWSMLLLLPALLVGFTVHELAHGLVAYLLGDTSQVERNRLSFNPLHHISWVGMVVFMLFRFGWAKPVWMDASQFRIKNQAFGMFLVAVAGSLANLLTGLLALLGVSTTAMIVWMSTGADPMDVWEFLMASDPGLDAQGLAVALSGYMVMVNLALAFFNLLPLPPLDGFQAVVSLVAAIRAALGHGVAVAPVFRPTPPSIAVTDAASEQPGREQEAGQPAAGEPASREAERGEPTAGDVDARTPAQIHFDIGLEYQKVGQLDEAIARYRQATAHDEQFAMAYYNLGLAYWAKGRIPLAVSAFRAALQAGGDMAVRVQAEFRLRELADIDPEQEGDPGTVPPPLVPGQSVQPVAETAPALDRAVVRRVWISLAAGGIALAALAFGAWMVVTLVALMAAL
ncbi:MAG: tetratricopeptide repeat protein [Anaerolineae bacterium]|jgi:Zn-dependent protease